MPFIFVVGIVLIALEDKIHINKSATALLMSVLLWLILMFNSQQLLDVTLHDDFQRYIQREEIAHLSSREQGISYMTNRAFLPHMGDVSETLFFVMCSLLIVNIVDKYGGFLAIIQSMRTNNKRKLLWMIGISSFFFSALLDNLAAAIVLIAILRKLVPDKTDRMKYASIIILAANAGGSWSPIGDVTTLLLWTGGNITAMHQITRLFLPAFVNLLTVLVISHFWLFRKGTVLRQNRDLSADEIYIEKIPERSRIVIFWIGIFSLALVPVFQSLTHLPAFMCVMLGLALLWVYTDLTYGRVSEIVDADKLRVPVLSRAVDLPTIFFFFGILMSVAAMSVSGLLLQFSGYLTSWISEPYLLSVIIGAASALVDNVALVSATMGMFPLQNITADLTPYMHYFVPDGGFWTLLAYCAVTGGSILIIGSATGVAVMGLEKISFMYYLKRFTPLAALGYIAGILVFLLLS
jgi:Na+/H+ antiporter NhaD/arsenite permease-like protein